MGLNVSRNGKVRRGTKLSAMMTDVTPLKDKSVWIDRCPSKAGQVAGIVAGCIEEIEGTISEEVVSPKVADSQRRALPREV